MSPPRTKRLMLPGTAVFMMPALARIEMPLLVFPGPYLLVLRRIHRAAGTGVASTMILFAATVFVSRTASWARFVQSVPSG